MNENKEFKLPDITQEALRHVNATPDEMYPIRILQAHRENCNCKWSNSAGGIETDDPLLKLMNEQNDERAKILDKAISVLQEFENIIGCKNCEGTDICVLKCTECSLLPHSLACHQFMRDDQMEYLYKRKNKLIKFYYNNDVIQ